MPLHLLGKKSWNVYNSENVERVRRDEAEEKTRQEAGEQRMQEEDAARRIAILRGEEPPALLHQQAEEAPRKPDERNRRHDDSLPRKRRKLRGEDDTDRDIRFAREDAETGEKAKRALVKREENNNEAPLQDHAGNIQLIPAPDVKDIRKAEKNAEAEEEKAKKRKREEDQYTMRFSNAAGFKNGTEKPWYASNGKQTTENATSEAAVLADAQEKDVWGNADPLRKERERSRISSNDPFAAMQQAQRQLQQSERDRGKWNTERKAEIEELKAIEDRKRRHEKKHRRHGDQDDLEGFSLDASIETRRERSDRDRRHRRHGNHRHRSKSRSGERHTSSRRHSSKE